MTYMRRVCGNRIHKLVSNKHRHTVTPVLYVVRGIHLTFKTISRDVSRHLDEGGIHERRMRDCISGEKKDVLRPTTTITTNSSFSLSSFSLARPGSAQSPRKNSIVSFRFYGAVTRKISSSRIRKRRRWSGDGKDQSGGKLFQGEIHAAMQIPGSSIREEKDMHLSECRYQGLTRATSSS